uniref:Uncharacterized protein n=1 Tax=Quercus lobata TaxID=97700 RepID=A0A7N2LV42_QUELO
MGMGSKDQEGIPIPLHSFGSSIVRFVSLITEFQNEYLLNEYECGERFFFGVERVKEGLRKLEPGLQVDQREIPKYNSRIRDWYLKVKDIVYQLEDLFEDIELQVMAESYDSPSLYKDKFEELLKDDGLDSCIHLILFLLLHNSPEEGTASLSLLTPNSIMYQDICSSAQVTKGLGCSYLKCPASDSLHPPSTILGNFDCPKASSFKKALLHPCNP